jgi:hypothetical protein
VILAHPHIAEQEIDSEDDEMKEAVKRPLGIVSVKLTGETVEPRLVTDKKERLDEETQFVFNHWSVEDIESPDTTQKLVLKNETKANLMFNVSTEGPFELVASKTNSGAKHPLA